MWLADNWKEYEVIDCSEGEKLEMEKNLNIGATISSFVRTLR